MARAAGITLEADEGGATQGSHAVSLESVERLIAMVVAEERAGYDARILAARSLMRVHLENAELHPCGYEKTTTTMGSGRLTACLKCRRLSRRSAN